METVLYSVRLDGECVDELTVTGRQRPTVCVMSHERVLWSVHSAALVFSLLRSHWETELDQLWLKKAHPQDTTDRVQTFCRSD